MQETENRNRKITLSKRKYLRSRDVYPRKMGSPQQKDSKRPAEQRLIPQERGVCRKKLLGNFKQPGIKETGEAHEWENRARERPEVKPRAGNRRRPNPINLPPIIGGVETSRKEAPEELPTDGGGRRPRGSVNLRRMAGPKEKRMESTEKKGAGKNLRVQLSKIE